MSANITAIKRQKVTIPFSRPIKTAIHDMRSVGCLLITVESDQGVVGESYLFTLNGVRLNAFDEMVKGLSTFFIGEDPRYIERIWQRVWTEVNPTGHKGVTIAALSALDTACWDLNGKLASLPLHQLFGACRDDIDTYASGGLWLIDEEKQLQQDAKDFIAQGFRAMKIRVGSQDMQRDIKRVAMVRETVGDDITLLADCNQALSVKQAIRLGKALAPYEIAWLEEPVDADDLEGHAEVRRSLDMDIASGETEYTRFGMQAMLQKRACDVLMPDLQRIGGLSEMRKTAALASAYHVPISTHIFTEHSLAIAGSAPNCRSVEHMPWFESLFNEEMIVREGKLTIPHRPGCGFTFNHRAIAKMKV
ncbi:mandelate racemase/muconate lactonizing enzyme family protein [Enterovibrio coralii]|uniref:Mandelate racemase n=1 Tax=Enterovibrio coralii TaxID=294935 RepID=A0A135I8W3_9GAMM|nr:mandelate racemase/muconate lactonizing enzyme family protein [Enterovibrio coralii]KXF81890.1 mandelate racemase [Enterovibrio coralii]